jgi:pimeloyl-ACP methyl ester carboxylesterase
MRNPGGVTIRGNAAAEIGTAITDPFASFYAAPVVGGALTVAHAGPAPDRADAVVLAIHGITANLMAWRGVARELTRDTRVCILAPDLRGRGKNAGLPGPYGLDAHVADMLAVLDRFGVQQVVLAGHSMGATLAARIAAEHPRRAASLVLADGGLSVGEISDEEAAAAHAITVGPAMARQALTFTSSEAYLEFWHLHPAFVEAWNDDVEAYVLHDLAGKPGAWRYRINVEAAEVDSDQMLWDPSNRNVIDRVDAPIRVLRAERGTLDDDNPLIPQHALDRFIAENPAAEVEQVQGVNHYTLTLGESPGPVRVAAAIDAAARAAAGA